MPNATVRANARPMSEKTTRRAILGALAAVAALASPRAVAAPPPPIDPVFGRWSAIGLRFTLLARRSTGRIPRGLAV
jgi:hypothetical protein